LFFDELLDVVIEKPENSRSIFLYMGLMIDHNKQFVYNKNLNHKITITKIVNIIKNDQIIDNSSNEKYDFLKGLIVFINKILPC
jgi:hypothetical protein